MIKFLAGIAVGSAVTATVVGLRNTFLEAFEGLALDDDDWASAVEDSTPS